MPLPTPLLNSQPQFLCSCPAALTSLPAPLYLPAARPVCPCTPFHPAAPILHPSVSLHCSCTHACRIPQYLLCPPMHPASPHTHPALLRVPPCTLYPTGPLLYTPSILPPFIFPQMHPVSLHPPLLSLPPSCPPSSPLHPTWSLCAHPASLHRLYIPPAPCDPSCTLASPLCLSMHPSCTHCPPLAPQPFCGWATQHPPVTWAPMVMSVPQGTGALEVAWHNPALSPCSVPSSGDISATTLCPLQDRWVGGGICPPGQRDLIVEDVPGCCCGDDGDSGQGDSPVPLVSPTPCRDRPAGVCELRAGHLRWAVPASAERRLAC